MRSAGDRRRVIFEREFDVLADGAMREQGQRLEHHAGRALVGGHIIDALAAQDDVARGRRLHAGQHADQGRLAGARRADDGEELAVGDVEIDAVDGVELAEGLGEVFQDENGRALRHGSGMEQETLPGNGEGPEL